MSKFLDYDPLTGVTMTFDYDHANDKFAVGYHQDVAPILESNAIALGDLDAHKAAAKNEWSRYARIPWLVIMEWKQKHGVDFFNKNHSKRVMQLINDPEYSKVKTTSYKHDR